MRAAQRLEGKKTDGYELYFTRKSSTSIQVKDQKVDSLTRAEDVGLAIRVLKKKRMGFSYSTSMDDAAVDRAVERAMEISAQMPADEHNQLFSFSTAVYPEVDSQDTRGLAVPVDDKIGLAMRLEKTCRSTDKRITGLRSAGLGETLYEVHMVDSAGEHIYYTSTMYTSSILCKAEQDGDSQMGGDFGFSNFLDTLDIDSVARESARYATELLGAKGAPTMICPAVLRNNVVADLLDFLSSSFSAEEIDKGRSMLAGKQSQKIFAENVTIVNDGLMPNGFGTSPFDGEGVPSSKTCLVDGGIFQSALYDLYHARKHDKDPTGSANRGIKAPPSIGTSNLFLQVGKRTPAQLMDGIARGILITDLMGVHTANPVTGDFSLGASGILIEGGKLTRPVKGFAVAGNVMELFSKMTDIGNDMKWFGATGAPSARIAELSVGGN
jgi:PmbA protein